VGCPDGKGEWGNKRKKGEKKKGEEREVNVNKAKKMSTKCPKKVKKENAKKA